MIFSYLFGTRTIWSLPVYFGFKWIAYFSKCDIPFLWGKGKRKRNTYKCTASQTEAPESEAVGVQTDAIDAALSGGDRRAVAVGVQTEVPPLAGDVDVCHVCYQYATVQTHHIYHLGFLAGEHFA